jgi:hypothetical protein
LADDQAVGSILDDDNLTVGDITVVEGDGGVATAVFTVSLGVPLAHEVRLDYATANGSATAGSDYLAASGTVVLAPGQTSQTIQVGVLGDRIDEGDQTILLNLLRPVGVILSDSQVAATISDDDPLPRLSINDPVIVEGNAGTRNLTFTVSLSEPSGRNVSVQYATADATALAGSDYAARSGTLTFLAGWTSQTVTVVISGDTAIEPDERLLVQLSGAVNATLADAQGEGWLLNDDSSGSQSASSGEGPAPRAMASRSPPELPPAAVDQVMQTLGILSRPQRHQQPTAEPGRSPARSGDRAEDGWESFLTDLLP